MTGSFLNEQLLHIQEYLLQIVAALAITNRGRFISSRDSHYESRQLLQIGAEQS